MSSNPSGSTSPAVFFPIRSITEMPSTFSGHTSQISRSIAEEIGKSYASLKKLNALGLSAKGTFQQLEEIFFQCSSEGWDGENARPISEEVRQLAIVFLDSLPLGIEAPEVGAEPDGDITLEWYRSPRWILSVSVSSKGKLHYAALFGASELYGSEPFFGKAPNIILDLINKITAGSRDKIKAA